MSWWLWILLWLVLFGGTIVLLVFLGLSLWDKTVALGRELTVAAERIEVLQDELDKLETISPPDPIPAIFISPSQLRQERVLRGRGKGRGRGNRRSTKQSIPRSPRNR